MYLTESNHNQGFLVAESYMAGISENPEQPDAYVAYVLDIELGSYLFHQSFLRLSEAIESLGRFEFAWSYHSISGNCSPDCRDTCAKKC